MVFAPLAWAEPATIDPAAIAESMTKLLMRIIIPQIT